MEFEWDEAKNLTNIRKHGLSFYVAQKAFFDKNRMIFEDEVHSNKEKRYFCIGKTGDGIATVRFTMRKGKIRIFGAGYWRKGRNIYEKRS